jgi:hypothetical protein
VQLKVVELKLARQLLIMTTPHLLHPLVIMNMLAERVVQRKQ